MLRGRTFVVRVDAAHMSLQVFSPYKTLATPWYDADVRPTSNELVRDGCRHPRRLLPCPAGVPGASPSVVLVAFQPLRGRSAANTGW